MNTLEKVGGSAANGAHRAKNSLLDFNASDADEQLFSCPPPDILAELQARASARIAQITRQLRDNYIARGLDPRRLVCQSAGFTIGPTKFFACNPQTQPVLAARMTGILEHIYELLGPAVLLPYALNLKYPKGEEGWQLRTYANTQTQDYQRDLVVAVQRGGNIGVRLGPLSGNLVTIDVDDDEMAGMYISDNPILANTLRTRGERGCNFWIRMKPGTAYPNSQGYYNLYTIEGHKYGEWRVGGGEKGAQTVIFGVHPHGINYEIVVDKPPLEIEFSQLKWFGSSPRETGATPSGGDLFRRILAYLAGCPPAISGNSGHIQTLKVATQLVIGFDLGIDGARPWLWEYNKKCQPLWSEKELEHKLQEAAKNELGREPGAKIHGESSRKSAAEDASGQRPGVENVENVEYDVIDWGAFSPISTNSTRGHCQEVPFPQDSILADYYNYVITQSEGADSYIIGAAMPLVAAILARNVWVPWANGPLFPNLYALLIGPPGNLKSTSIDPIAPIARGVIGELDKTPFYFLPHSYSPESLFDAYFQHPHRFLVCDDANATLIKWQNPYDGERLSSNFLTLFDGKPLSEGFRRNRTQGNLDSQERWTAPTSTNIVFGVTFNGCEFRNNAQRAGLQRRFLPYLAEEPVRTVDRPQPDEKALKGLAERFSLLAYLRGAFAWVDESKALFDQFKRSIDERRRACDILDDRTRGRLSTACAWLLKISMIFETTRLCYDATWAPDPEIVPASPDLQFRPDTLQIAIKHVEACLKAADTLDLIANRKSIAEQAEVLLEYLRHHFRAQARNGAIVLTRSQITGSYANQANRNRGPSVSDIYDRIIPYLISRGDAKLIVKDGKSQRRFNSPVNSPV
jgi:hypothetical protein